MAKTTKELKALITLAGQIDPSLQKSLIDAQKQTKNTSDKLGGLGKAGDKNFKLIQAGAKVAGVALAAMAAAGVAMLVKLGKAGFETAKDLQMLNGTVDMVFGEGAEKIDSWSKSLLNAYGLSELTAKKYATTLGGVLKNQDVAADSAALMSQNLTMLSADMASYYNQDPEQMFTTLQSAMTGEAGALKKLGINMSDAVLDTYALSQGMGVAYTAMTDADKATLRYNYILQETAYAQGNFAKSSDKLGNQQRLTKERFTQLATSLMSKAIPAATKLMQVFNDVMDSLDLDKIGSFISAMGDLAVEIAPIAMELLPVILSVTESLLTPLIKIVKIILPPVMKALKFFADILATIISGGARMIDDLVSFADRVFGSGRNSMSVPDKYARGGFASRPSIFGEAGLEAAIPIKRGNPRSLMLLERTADMLGVSDATPWRRIDHPVGVGGGISLTYAPTFSQGSRGELEPVLKKHVMDIEAMLERADRRRRRFSFG